MAVSPAYGRNPAGQRIVGSGQSATLPVPDTIALIAIGSPTRPFGGSSVSSSASPCPATRCSPRPRPAGRGSTVTGTVSLRSEYPSSPLKNEKPTGTAYATLAVGMTVRPDASAAHRHAKGRGRVFVSALPHAYRPDQEGAGTLGLEPQLARHGADRSPHSFEGHLRHVTGADDDEARETGEGYSDRLRRAGARSD